MLRRIQCLIPASYNDDTLPVSGRDGGPASSWTRSPRVTLGGRGCARPAFEGRFNGLTLMLSAVLILTGGAMGGVASPAFAACQEKARFVVMDSVARDRTTGLVWQRCALGTRWSGSRCVGARLALSQKAAEAAALALGAGWRLPTSDELYGLVDSACGMPPVDRAVFPDVPVDGGDGDPYWTSTPVGMAGLWYFIDLATGEGDGHSRGFLTECIDIA